MNMYLKLQPDDVLSWRIGKSDVSLRVLGGSGSLAVIASLLSSSNMIPLPVGGIFITVLEESDLSDAIWDKKDLLILVTAFGSSRPTKKLLTCPRCS